MLLLKNEMKDEFDRLGLSILTISRSDNKYLYITGPCGKELLQITDFPVSSKLTKTERKIAKDDYAIPMLHANEKVIKDYIKEVENRKIKEDEYDKEVEIFEAKNKNVKSIIHSKIRENYYDDDILGNEIKANIELIDNKTGIKIFITYTLYFYTSSKEYKEQIECSNIDTINDLTKVKNFLTKMKPDVKKVLDKFSELEEVRKIEREAQDKLKVECSL